MIITILVIIVLSFAVPHMEQHLNESKSI